MFVTLQLRLPRLAEAQLRQRHSIVTASGLSPGHSKMGVDQKVNRFTYAVKGKLRSVIEQLGYV